MAFDPRRSVPVGPEPDTDSEVTPTTSESAPASEPQPHERGHDTPTEPSAAPSPGGEDQEPDKAPSPDPEGDHEAKLEHDLEELAAKAQKADEYLELAQRTKADFENYRKRAAREAAAAQERGMVKLALELLPAVDNLDRALAATNDGAGGSDTLASGIKAVHSDVIAALARMGIEPYSPEGERFDPQHHEAVAQQPVDGTEPGTIVEVYQSGYRLRDSVLRPARVVVAA
jgi:molecular chaperone GrpE